MESEIETKQGYIVGAKPVTVAMIAKGVFIGVFSAAIAGAILWYGLMSLLRATGDIR